MTEQLMRYYERELALLRKSAQNFIHDHPQAAKGMRLNEAYYEDPNITRLLESVALLSARSHHRLDKKLPHTSKSLSAVLFPLYDTTIPAITSATFQPNNEAFVDPVHLAKGELFSSTDQQQNCFFSLCQDMVLSPLRLKETHAYTPPFPYEVPGSRDAKGMVSITLQTIQRGRAIHSIMPQNLDIYIKGFNDDGISIVDLLLSHLLQIVVSNPSCDQVQVIDADHWVALASEPTFRVLPEAPNEAIPYAMLLEYLNIPEKSRFFKIENFNVACQNITGDSLILTFLLDTLPSDYVRLIDQHTFTINSGLLVNAFEIRSEPIIYDYHTLSAPILSESSINEVREILSVLDVVEVTPDGELPITPLFKQLFSANPNREKWYVEHHDYNLDATAQDEFGLMLTDIPNERGRDVSRQFSAKLLCSNQIAPSTIPSGTIISPVGDRELPGMLSLIQTPSVPLPKQHDESQQWQLIELLASNFSNFLTASDPVQKLQQLLMVLCRSPAPYEMIQSMRSVKFSKKLSRLTIEGKTVFLPGTRIDITISQPAGRHYLSQQMFFRLLNVFFGELCGFDRFIELHIKLLGNQGALDIPFERIQGRQQCL